MIEAKRLFLNGRGNTGQYLVATEDYPAVSLGAALPGLIGIEPLGENSTDETLIVRVVQDEQNWVIQKVQYKNWEPSANKWWFGNDGVAEESAGTLTDGATVSVTAVLSAGTMSDFKSALPKETRLEGGDFLIGVTDNLNSVLVIGSQPVNVTIDMSGFVGSVFSCSIIQGGTGQITLAANQNYHFNDLPINTAMVLPNIQYHRIDLYLFGDSALVISS